MGRPASSYGFLKKGVSGDQQGKGLLDMTLEPASTLSGISETSLFKQAQNKIVDNCQNTSGSSNGHPGGIFMKSNIATIM